MYVILRMVYIQSDRFLHRFLQLIGWRQHTRGVWKYQLEVSTIIAASSREITITIAIAITIAITIAFVGKNAQDTMPGRLRLQWHYAQLLSQQCYSKVVVHNVTRKYAPRLSAWMFTFPSYIIIY